MHIFKIHKNKSNLIIFLLIFNFWNFTHIIYKIDNCNSTIKLIKKIIIYRKLLSGISLLNLTSMWKDYFYMRGERSTVLTIKLHMDGQNLLFTINRSFSFTWYASLFGKMAFWSLIFICFFNLISYLFSFFFFQFDILYFKSSSIWSLITFLRYN